MRSKSRNTVSAGELMNQLQSNEVFMRKRDEAQACRKATEQHLLEDEKSLLADLAGVGIHVSSVWNLVNQKQAYSAAIPVLVKHLRLPHVPKIYEGIIRALTVKDARGVAGRALLGELKRVNEVPHEMRWILANALTEAADLDIADELKLLILAEQRRDIREILIRASKRCR